VWVRAGAEGVVIAGRRQEKLDEVIASTHAYNNNLTKVIGFRTDVKVEEDVDNLFQKVKATFGRPADVVYSNAGWVSELKSSAEESVETWWSVYVSWKLPLNDLGLSRGARLMKLTGGQCARCPQYRAVLDQKPV